MIQVVFLALTKRVKWTSQRMATDRQHYRPDPISIDKIDTSVFPLFSWYNTGCESAVPTTSVSLSCGWSTWYCIEHELLSFALPWLFPCTLGYVILIRMHIPRFHSTSSVMLTTWPQSYRYCIQIIDPDSYIQHPKPSFGTSHINPRFLWTSSSSSTKYLLYSWLPLPSQRIIRAPCQAILRSTALSGLAKNAKSRDRWVFTFFQVSTVYAIFERSLEAGTTSNFLGLSLSFFWRKRE